MDCAPSPTGALFEEDAALAGSGFPLGENDVETDEGAQSLRVLHTKAKIELSGLWLLRNKAPAADQEQAQQAFATAFDELKTLMLRQARALPMLQQWELVNEQYRLCQVGKNLTDQGVVGEGYWSQPEAADAMVSVLVELMESLIPPWMPTRSGDDRPAILPLPTTDADALVRLEDERAIVNHFVAEYKAVLAVAGKFASAITTTNPDTPTPKLRALVEHLDAKVRRMRANEDGRAKTSQFERMRLLWHVQRDLTYQRGLPGDPHNAPFENAGSGKCGYLSFVASVGLDGVTADPQLGRPVKGTDAERANRDVHERAAAWLNVGTGDGDLTDYNYSTVISMRSMELANDASPREAAQREVADAAQREAADRKKWKANVAARKRDTYWATLSDWTAIAAVYKRRIHIYDIMNAPGQTGQPLPIEYFKHRHAYGDVDHRPVCIASCYSGDFRKGAADGRETNHYTAILTSMGHCVPWAGGHAEDALPYADDNPNPFGLVESRERPAVPKDCPKPELRYMERFQRTHTLREARRKHYLARARVRDYTERAVQAREVLSTSQDEREREQAQRALAELERYEGEAQAKQEAVERLEEEEAARQSGGRAEARGGGGAPPLLPAARAPRAPRPPNPSGPAPSKEAIMAAIVARFKAHATQQLTAIRDKLKGTREVTVGSTKESYTTMVEGHVKAEWKEWAGARGKWGLAEEDGESMRATFATWLHKEFGELRTQFMTRMKYGKLGWPGSKAHAGKKGAKLLYGVNRLLVWGGNAGNWTGDKDEAVKGKGQAGEIEYHHVWEVGIVVSPVEGLPPVVEAGALDEQLQSLERLDLDGESDRTQDENDPVQEDPPADPVQEDPMQEDPPAARPRPAVDRSAWKTPDDVDDQWWRDVYTQRVEAWERLVGTDQSDAEREAHSRQLLNDLWEAREGKKRKEEGEARKRSDADRRSRGDGEGDRSEGGRIAESEGSDDEEAARYNYTEALLTDTQIAFVSNMLKTAHEAFVVHHSNRHNYGKIALMDGSRDAVVSGSNEKKAPANTTQMSKLFEAKTQELREWEDPDDLNGGVLEAWKKYTDGNPWYARGVAGKPQSGGRDVYNQSMQIVRQLLLDVFKSYKKAVAWWISFKGGLEWPAGKQQNDPRTERHVAFGLRKALVEWLGGPMKVRYQNGDKLIKCAQFLWDFMERAKEHLDGLHGKGYEEEKATYGDFINLAQSEERLHRLTAAQETVSETRQALRHEIAQSEALIEMANSGTGDWERELDDLKAKLTQAKQQDDDASNPEAETTRRKDLQTSWRAMFEKFVPTRESLESRYRAAAVHARALLRELRDIGYDDDDTPEYKKLLAALEEAELSLAGSVGDPPENGERATIWSLVSAYREAFSAVYGDDDDVAAFKAIFEKEADEREREQAGAEPAVPKVADAHGERAYREATAELERLQQQERALQATALSAEARSLKTRLGQLETQATLGDDSAMAEMVQRLQGLLHSGSAANSPGVQQALEELEAHVARAAQK